MAEFSCSNSPSEDRLVKLALVDCREMWSMSKMVANQKLELYSNFDNPYRKVDHGNKTLLELLTEE